MSRWAWCLGHPPHRRNSTERLPSVIEKGPFHDHDVKSKVNHQSNHWPSFDRNLLRLNHRLLDRSFWSIRGQNGSGGLSASLMRILVFLEYSIWSALNIWKRSKMKWVQLMSGYFIHLSDFHICWNTSFCLIDEFLPVLRLFPMFCPGYCRNLGDFWSVRNR